MPAKHNHEYRKSVLVVDDDVMSVFLELLGHEVHAAANGARWRQ
jgi:hypothetical protein